MKSEGEVRARLKSKWCRIEQRHIMDKKTGDWTIHVDIYCRIAWGNPCPKSKNKEQFNSDCFEMVSGGGGG